jgi:hypothetical protein
MKTSREKRPVRDKIKEIKKMSREVCPRIPRVKIFEDERRKNLKKLIEREMEEDVYE